MTRDFGDRDNTRFRDLLDLVLLIENDLLSPEAVADAARAVWAERNRSTPPRRLPSLPGSWPARYEQLADAYHVEARTFVQAVTLVRSLWTQMHPPKKEQ